MRPSKEHLPCFGITVRDTSSALHKAPSCLSPKKAFPGSLNYHAGLLLSISANSKRFSSPPREVSVTLKGTKSDSQIQERLKFSAQPCFQSQQLLLHVTSFVRGLFARTLSAPTSPPHTHASSVPQMLALLHPSVYLRMWALSE